MYVSKERTKVTIKIVLVKKLQIFPVGNKKAHAELSACDKQHNNLITRKCPPERWGHFCKHIHISKLYQKKEF